MNKIIWLWLLAVWVAIGSVINKKPVKNQDIDTLCRPWPCKVHKFVDVDDLETPAEKVAKYAHIVKWLHYDESDWYYKDIHWSVCMWID